jgi:hypothetical protein
MGKGWVWEVQSGGEAASYIVLLSEQVTNVIDYAPGTTMHSGPRSYEVGKQIFSGDTEHSVLGWTADNCMVPRSLLVPL